MSASVNDIHSALNETVVHEMVPVDSLAAIRVAVLRAASEKRPIAIAGGRYAMGGQQFCTAGMLLDTRPLNRILWFDAVRGLVEVESGIQWPALIEGLERLQTAAERLWGIAQKQTGADRLSIGGAVAANVHGRGLKMKPFVSDIEELKLVNAKGELMTCSRSRNQKLFSLVAGGYGLFGCIYSVTLRLVPRRTLERVVEVRAIDDLINGFEDRIRHGYLYGDFQFVTDENSDDFLRTGVFSCYRPIEWEGCPPSGQRMLTPEIWDKLISLAHTDKARVYQAYSRFYLSTSGQIYYTDSHQLANYSEGYHRRIDALTKTRVPASEMITEIYVPREGIGDFMAAVREDFRVNHTNLIYGTIRLIEPDEDSFMRWATQPWACVVFNLCTEHSPDGLERSAAAFRRLIDQAIEQGGNYYLTYHRWATPEQVESCYPRLREFLKLKQAYDPEERFQSDWYRHYRAMLI